MALAAATTVAMALPVALSAGSAQANPGPGPKAPSQGPSQAQVNRAQQDVASKRQSVAQIEAALSAATARMEAASNQAESAAEAYNGAMWRLQQARTASSAAQRAAALAAASVERQRVGIISLVTESYQNGTELNTATALMSDEGPRGLMNRYAVVSSAGDSMDARYEAFRTASGQARTAAAKATRAQKKQTALATDAKQLAVQAGQAASAAGAAANQISTQRQSLVQALAKAQNISVALATRRHAALEQIARQKAAAAARAKLAAERARAQKAAETRQRAAEQARAKRAAEQARHQADQAAQAAQDTPAPSDPGKATGGGASAPPVVTPAPGPVANPAPNQSAAVARAIDYAKRQLGSPYLWGAAGPTRFDCSGLTMMAWGQSGVSLPHYSVAQFAQSTRISMADAKPGDLLFWSNNGSPSGIHHVALYLGGGQFIEAPHTGSYVRYNSIYNWYPDFVARP